MALSSPHHKSTAPEVNHLPKDWLTGEYGIPVARYINREFAQLEAKYFWPRVWQMACRVDQVAKPGDFTVYNILNESVLVVRVDNDAIKAYHNVCPHRATTLALRPGHFQSQMIVCPFHGWRWNLRGENTFLPNADEFKGGCLKPSEVSLKEVHVHIWGGFVYINFDKNQIPFESMIAPVKSMCEDVMLSEMKFYYHYEARVNCNWKIAQEAFLEAYHVPQTHPQLSGSVSHEVATALMTYESLANGHGLFQSGGLSNIARLPKSQLDLLSREQQVDQLVNRLITLQRGQDAMAHTDEIEIARTMRYRQIPDGVSVGEEFQRVIREHYNAQGRPIGSAEALARITDVHIFPNIVFLPMYGNAVMYRARPTRDNDPDWSIFDMYAIRTYAEGHTAPSWKTVEAKGELTNRETWFLIPSQDFTAITRQQQGLKSSAMQSTLMSGRQEGLIFNMHRELDRYLGSV